VDDLTAAGDQRAETSHLTAVDVSCIAGAIRSKRAELIPTSSGVTVSVTATSPVARGQ